MTSIEVKAEMNGDAELDIYGDSDVLNNGDDVLNGDLDEDAILQTNQDDSVLLVPGEESAAADSDLLDAVLTEPAGSVSQSVSETSRLSSSATSVHQSSPVSLSNQANSGNRKFCVYVGNMTWWTTDQDLLDAAEAIGIQDVVDCKFHDNRANGQSKGFALLVMNSENSQRLALEKFQEKQLHGQKLAALPYCKQSLATFETASKRPEDDRRNKAKEQQDRQLQMQMPQTAPPPGAQEKNVNFLGSVRIGSGAPGAGGGGLQPAMSQASAVRPMMRTVIGAPNMQMQPMNMMHRGGMMGQPMIMHPQQAHMMAPTRIAMAPMMPRPQMMQPQQPQPVAPPAGVQQPVVRPPPGYMNSGPPMRAQATNQPPPGFPPVGAHVNPNVYPGVGGQHSQEPPLSEPEFDEIMNRNRTVSSSAISRAVSDAAAGDYASAIETLVTAISLIRQSRVSHDDRCKVLISSLQDTLHGIEAKSYTRGRSSKGRDRSRSPESRKRRRRASRSRSRSRERAYDYDRHAPAAAAARRY